MYLTNYSCFSKLLSGDETEVFIFLEQEVESKNGKVGTRVVFYLKVKKRV